MGANLCCISRTCIGGPATAAESGDGLEFACNGIWRRREKIEVRREKEASIAKKEYMSLEELMLASPGAPSSGLGFGSGGGEFNVSSRGGFKRKVHPTMISNVSSSSFCERLINESIAEEEYSGGDSLICRTESWKKKKKKVSFRLPEVSDVVVIYSPAPSPEHVNVAS